jgi:hypothetical protein
MEENMLDYVLTELDARKGEWPSISKAMQPSGWESYYSWLQKLGQRRIHDPGVNKIQELADYFTSNPRERRSGERRNEARP